MVLLYAPQLIPVPLPAELPLTTAYATGEIIVVDDPLPLPPPETVLYETNSTISPTKHPTARTTELPFVAVNSLSVSLTPFTNTSRNPTLYVN